MAYTVIRTDLMSGTKQPADLVSLRFYDANGKVAEVENGVIVKLEGYEGIVNVRVLMDGNQVFSQDVDTSMQMAVDVPVHGSTGMGVRELAIYINGVASGTDRVNFDE